MPDLLDNKLAEHSGRIKEEGLRNGNGIKYCLSCTDMHCPAYGCTDWISGRDFGYMSGIFMSPFLKLFVHLGNCILE